MKGIYRPKQIPHRALEHLEDQVLEWTRETRTPEGSTNYSPVKPMYDSDNKLIYVNERDIDFNINIPSDNQ